VNAIVSLKRNRELREELGKNGRRYILQNFSREKTASTYIEILQTMLNHGTVRHAGGSLATALPR